MLWRVRVRVFDVQTYGPGGGDCLLEHSEARLPHVEEPVGAQSGDEGESAVSEDRVDRVSVTAGDHSGQFRRHRKKQTYREIRC